jgi:hypothetical protein
MIKKTVLVHKQVFIGHSFSPEDIEVVNKVKNFLSYFGLGIDSGERPDARSISEKIKTRIIDCDIFLGIFTKREKLGDTDEYATSQWVIEEKTYAVSLNKRILLYLEEGVQFSPGLQADYEFIRFSRSHLSDALVKSIPYIFSVIANEEESNRDSDQTIDRYEALRLMKELIKMGLNLNQNEEDQNYVLRNALCRGMASDQFEGDHSSFEYFINFLNGQGYKIAPIAKKLFLRYSVLSKEAIENERLRLTQGIRKTGF